MLEYFDAFLIGLTATPEKRTLAFFHENIVSEYTRLGLSVTVDIIATKTGGNEIEYVPVTGRMTYSLEKTINRKEDRYDKYRFARRFNELSKIS